MLVRLFTVVRLLLLSSCLYHSSVIVLAAGTVSAGSSAPWKAGSGVIPFFAEFFHEDHGSMDRSAVVMDKGVCAGLVWSGLVWFELGCDLK